MSHAAALLTLILATLATWAVVAISIGALWAWQRQRQLGDLPLPTDRELDWNLSTDSVGTGR